MCLSSRPKWEEDVEFARPARKVKVRYVAPPATRRVTETIIRESKPSPPPAPPSIRPATPPKAPTPPPAPVPPRIEYVSVEETRGSPRTSRASVSNKGKSRRGSEIEEEIVRERVRERMAPPPPREEYETYRYVEAPSPRMEDRRRSRSITYETSPRVSSSRVVERERVVVEDGGRRREYYRRP